MESLNYIIVELVEPAYNNEVKVGTGQSVIVNSSIEDVSFISREATVISAPPFTILKPGDKVITHHNIFRHRYSNRGNLIDSNYLLKDNTYYIPLTEIFMYKRSEEWEALDPYCFIKPIEEVEEGEFINSLEDSYKGKVCNVGTVKYINKSLKEQGINPGDKILFSDYSEYEFTIDGELLYKMSTRDIYGKW